jgi:hypothetical protein
MDFARFILMIEAQTLWFSRADQFEDPLEGTHTDAELDHLRALPTPSGHPGGSVIDSYIRGSAFMRTTTYVNCWRAGKGESLAMWDLYGKGSGIVAVKSSVGLLKNEMANFSGSVFIAQVRYIEWSSAPWDNNALVMCARKDASYQHESEVRAMIWEAASSTTTAFSSLSGDPTTKAYWLGRTKNDPPFGVGVPIDVCKMITEVVVGPRERPWVAELVKSVMKRYGLGQPVTVSNRLTPR